MVVVVVVVAVMCKQSVRALTGKSGDNKVR